MVHTLTVVEELRKNGTYGAETRVPFIRIRGRWLEKHGFKPGAKVYVHEGIDGLTLTAEAPTGIYAIKPIDEIKAEFKALGIETEQRTKKARSTTVEVPMRIELPAMAVQEELRREPAQCVQSKAEQLAFAFGGDEPIPLEHFILTRISAREYSKLLEEY